MKTRGNLFIPTGALGSGSDLKEDRQKKAWSLEFIKDNMAVCVRSVKNIPP